MGSSLRLARPVVLSVATLLLALGTLGAQETPAVPGSSQHIGLLEDWSTRHVIFTRNSSDEDKWTVRNDPRFMHSTLLRYLREHGNQTGLGTAQAGDAGLAGNRWNDGSDGDPQDGQDQLPEWRKHHHIRPRNKHSKVDWSVSLGPNGGLAAGEAPAVYTYNYAVPSCSNLAAAPPTIGDFAVYTINAAPIVGTHQRRQAM